MRHGSSNYKGDSNLIHELVKQYKLKNTRETSICAMEQIKRSISSIYKIKANITNDNPLSAMEILCLALLATGINPDKCADILNISANTVKTYEQRIREKLGAKNRTHAFYIAQLRGYISIEL